MSGIAPPLVDLQGRVHDYLRISVTDRCNLRCTYCMPEDGVTKGQRAEILSLEEIGRLARLFVSWGFIKLRVTGGEPLVRLGIVELLQTLGQLPGLRALGLTTNGLLLEPLVPALRAAGVTHLNVSLDTFRPDRFQQITRRDGVERVISGIQAALSAGFTSVKLNCVLMRGVNDDELLDFVAFAKERAVAVRFIEYMPYGGNRWDERRLIPAEEILRLLAERYPLKPLPRETPSDTATRYVIPGHAGTLGIISSMSDHFCGACNRLRLTADGLLKKCLFERGGLSLRDVLRSGASDEELRAVVASVLWTKEASHASTAALEALASQSDRSMARVGG